VTAEKQRKTAGDNGARHNVVRPGPYRASSENDRTDCSVANNEVDRVVKIRFWFFTVIMNYRYGKKS